MAMGDINGKPLRKVNFNANHYVRPRGIGSFISNNNKPLLHHKLVSSMAQPNDILSSPSQQYQSSKPITPVM